MDKRTEIISIIYNNFLSRKEYKIGFYQHVICDKSNTCNMYRENLCKAQQLTYFDLKKYYDTLSLEVKIGRVKIDICLTNSKNDKQKPVLIIIGKPTIKIQELIEFKQKIIIINPNLVSDNSSFNEGITEYFTMVDDKSEDVVCFYNFSSKDTVKKPLQLRMFVRFCYYKSGRATCTNIDDLLDCDERYKYRDKNAVTELNIPYNFEVDHTALGYAYLWLNNHKEKVCGFCKYYRRYHLFQDGLCTLYKKFETPQHPDFFDARGCQYYHFHQEKLDKLNEINQINGIEEL